MIKYKLVGGGFCGGPVVKNLPPSAGGMRLIPGQGAEIPHASWLKYQNIKKKKKKKTMAAVLQQIKSLKMTYIKNFKNT